MMFGDIVTLILVSRCPVVPELFLTDSVSKPVIFHIHGFELFHDIVVDTEGCCVVRLNWCGGLGMTKELQSVARRYCFMAVDV